MDNLDKMREIIIESLRYYANLRYATGEVNRLLIIDKDSDNYLILLEGWENKERVHGCLVHLQIIDLTNLLNSCENQPRSLLIIISKT